LGINHLSSDIIVIGAGIAGLVTAHRLIRSGASVTILERDRCGREASWAGAGILSPLLPWNYAEPVTCLTRLSKGLFPEFIEALITETGIDPEYHASGMLVLPELLPDSSHASAIAWQEGRNQTAEDWCGRHAFPLRRVHSREIAPALAQDEIALWLPDVSQVRNPRLLQALIWAVNLAGGKIIEHAEVSKLKIEHGRVQSISTGQGIEHSAGHYIMTAGAWSRELLGEHALKLSIWPVRGQILLFKAPRDLLKTIILREGDYFYLIPRRDGHILAGSTLEEAGFDKSLTIEARQMLLAKAQALMPSLTEATVAGHWAGLRPGSPDNIPIIDRHPSIPNLYLNSGHYRYGITMAPGSAHLLVNLILDKPQPLDMTPYRWPS
jgi:glycine oxidase